VVNEDGSFISHSPTHSQQTGERVATEAEGSVLKVEDEVDAEGESVCKS
jgi:hypothetical protein